VELNATTCRRAPLRGCGRRSRRAGHAVFLAQLPLGRSRCVAGLLSSHPAGSTSERVRARSARRVSSRSDSADAHRLCGRSAFRSIPARAQRDPAPAETLLFSAVGGGRIAGETVAAQSRIDVAHDVRVPSVAAGGLLAARSLRLSAGRGKRCARDRALAPSSASMRMSCCTWQRGGAASTSRS